MASNGLALPRLILTRNTLYSVNGKENSMCRLLAWHSAEPVSVHQVLGQDSQSLDELSHLHKDGWGMGYGIDGTLVTVRDAGSAYDSVLFKEVSDELCVCDAIVHLRWATEELTVCIENTHPFEKTGPRGEIVFAHNGGIARGEALRALIDDDLWLEREGDTDSEQYFAALITELRKTDNDFVHAYSNLLKNVDNIDYSSLNALILTADDVMIVAAHKAENRPEHVDADYYELSWATENGITSAWSTGVRPSVTSSNNLPTNHLLKINRASGDAQVFSL